MRYLKIILLFLIFFAVFYYEPLDVAGIKFSLLWKIFLFLPMLVFVITRRQNKSSGFIRTGYLWGIKNILNFSIIKYPAETLLLTLKSFNLVFIYHFLRLKDYNSIKLLSITTTIIVFIILSSIPFHLNIIDPLGESYNLEIYQSSDDTYAYVGIFQNAHAASVITALALINLIYIFKLKRNKLLLPVIMLGFVNLYLTYVRTGYLIFIIGFIYYLFINRKNIKLFVNTVFLSLLLVITAYQLYTDDPLIFDRLLNLNKYSSINAISIESIGSGRTLFWIVNLDIWFNDLSFSEKMFGVGEEIGKDLLKNKIGMRIFSHNGFIDALLQNGLIGLIIFLWFLIFFYKELRKHKSSPYFRLGITALISYCVLNLVQGGYFFLFDVLIALDIALVYSYRYEVKRNKTLIKNVEYENSY